MGFLNLRLYKQQSVIRMINQKLILVTVIHSEWWKNMEPLLMTSTLATFQSIILHFSSQFSCVLLNKFLK